MRSRILSMLWCATATSFLRAAEIPEGQISSQLTYAEAIEAIVRRNTDVAGQKAKAEATEAHNLATQLSMLPSVSLGAGLTRSNTLGNDLNRRGLEADVNFNLFRFGGDLAAMRAGNAEVRAQNYLYDETILKTEAAAVSALNNLIQREMEQDIWQRIVDLRKLSLSIAEERFHRGLLAQQEVLKVSVDFENDVARLRDAQTESLRARAALIQLLGHDSVERAWPWKERAQENLERLKNLPLSDLSRRPDWKAAERSLEAMRAQTSRSWAKVFPSLDLALSYGYYNESQLGGLDHAAQWSAGLQLNVPLFDRLVNYSDYRAQVKMVVGAEQGLEKVKRTARAELESSRGTLLIALESARAREKTLSTSRDLYRDNLKRFRGGLVDANALSVDQERLYRSELLSVAGWSNVHTYVQKLCHAVGRRLSVCTADPAPPTE